MKSHKVTNLSKTDSAKKFLGTTTFDKINLRHSFVTQVFTESAIDQNLFFHPMSVPGPKLEQYVYLYDQKDAENPKFLTNPCSFSSFKHLGFNKFYLILCYAYLFKLYLFHPRDGLLISWILFGPSN